MSEDNPLKDWRGMLAASTIPLTKEQSNLFITLCMASVSKAREVAGTMDDVFLYQVLVKRLEAYSPHITELIDPRILILCAGLSDRPGIAVLWAYTLAHMLIGKDTLTLDDWTMAFPMGIPSMEETHKLWDYQKGFTHNIKKDNLLDDFNYWPKKR